MGYSTVVAGTTITASWANANVRDQVVTPFSSTSARDSAITSPVVGMASYIKSNDTAEGFTTYTSAAVWRKPWSMPWGILSYTSDTTSQASIGTSDVDMTALTNTRTYTANRYVRVRGIVGFNGNSTGTTFYLKVKESASTLGLGYVSGASLGHTILSEAIITPTAASHTYKLAAACLSGTFARTSDTATLVIEDIGPSGAPA